MGPLRGFVFDRKADCGKAGRSPPVSQRTMNRLCSACRQGPSVGVTRHAWSYASTSTGSSSSGFAEGGPLCLGPSRSASPDKKQSQASSRQDKARAMTWDVYLEIGHDCLGPKKSADAAADSPKRGRTPRGSRGPTGRLHSAKPAPQLQVEVGVVRQAQLAEKSPGGATLAPQAAANPQAPACAAGSAADGESSVPQAPSRLRAAVACAMTSADLAPAAPKTPKGAKMRPRSAAAMRSSG